MNFFSEKIISELIGNGVLTIILAWFMIHYQKIVKALIELQKNGIQTQEKMNNILENICDKLNQIKK